MNRFSRNTLLTAIGAGVMLTALEVWKNGDTTKAWVFGGMTIVTLVLSIVTLLMFDPVRAEAD